MSETKAQTMRRLFNDNGLVEEDVFIMERFDKKAGIMKRIPIITRSGIEKIQSKRRIEITYEVEAIDLALNSCAIRAIGVMRTKEGNIENHIQTFGSASPQNTNITQIVEVAEKRARARAVLMLAGFYQEGYHSEDENMDA